MYGSAPLVWWLHVPLNKPDLNLHQQSGGDCRPVGGTDSNARSCDWTVPEGAVSSTPTAAYVSPSCGGAARVEMPQTPQERAGPSVHRPSPPQCFPSEERRVESGASVVLTLAINTRPTRINLVWHSWIFQTLHPPQTGQHSIWRQLLDSRGRAWTPPPKRPGSNLSHVLGSQIVSKSVQCHINGLESIPNHHKETDLITSKWGYKTKLKFFLFIKRRDEHTAFIPALTYQCDWKKRGKTQGLKTRMDIVASFISLEKKTKTNKTSQCTKLRNRDHCCTVHNSWSLPKTSLPLTPVYFINSLNSKITFTLLCSWDPRDQQIN